MYPNDEEKYHGVISMDNMINSADTPEPMILSPKGKDYLWGGTKLKTEYYKDININPLSETWECSVHEDGPSMVASGRFEGSELREVLKMHPEYMGTKIDKKNGFPILVKLIDAKRDLSVQVHPSDEYAYQYEGNQNGKTEFWYILEAEPGAKLVCGFSHDVTREKLEKGIEKGDLSKHLQYVPVHRGDVFFIPAGTVHAIGSGIVLAEIQESSNLTYRLYDYNRVDPKTGKTRELHFEKSCNVLDMSARNDIRQKPKKIEYNIGSSREILIRCRYFESEKIVCTMGLEFTVTDASFQVLLCLDGDGGIRTDAMNRPLMFHKGECIFIPAGSGRCHVLGKMELLKIRC